MELRNLRRLVEVPWSIFNIVFEQSLMEALDVFFYESHKALVLILYRNAFTLVIKHFQAKLGSPL